MTPRSQYRDPLIGILNYIAEVRLRVCPLTSSLLSGFQKKCSETVIAVVHDDNLQIGENMVRLRQIFELGATSITRT